MKRVFTLILTASIAWLALSCDRVQSIIHDGEVVARVGKHKLYSSELNAYIPNGISPEDSTRLALQYINTWASDLLFLDVAEKELSKSEKDVSVELEDYRRSLLKYRYEQNFVNQRLDTAITAHQIESYYDSHTGTFTLTLPIVKARFLSISKDSPSLATLRKKMSSEDPVELAEADSIAYSTAMKYTDYDGAWIDVTTLAREFGVDYVQLLSKVKGGFIEEDDGKGNLNIAYVASMMKEGETGPVEYYDARIRDIILSTRKQSLLNGLEQDLLTKAKSQENFEIY